MKYLLNNFIDLIKDEKIKYLILSNLLFLSQYLIVMFLF